MLEASNRNVLVKGGKYLEAVKDADVIVFDKTGTLTNANPQVQKVTPLNGYSRDEVLRIAACLEEHFPHSVANAIVNQAKKKAWFMKKNMPKWNISLHMALRQPYMAYIQ